ncbi:MAG TPA: hypothetical protein VLD67_15135 [Vicinamibacterales bacterium]|nr:hypothetical protein [Vicinamibacterales bacterium]
MAVQLDEEIKMLLGTRWRDALVRTVRRIIASAVAVAFGLAFAALPAGAQQTRAEEVGKKQEEKAAVAAPYQPNRFEAIMLALEESFVSPPDGFFPAFDSVYSGGGFTLGAGYRNFFGRKAVWDVRGLYSIKNYKMGEFGIRTPWDNRGRWTIGFRTGWRDATQVGYYGVGNNTSQDDRANSRIQQGYGEIAASFRPSSWTRLHATSAYEEFKTEEGQGRAPSIETIYNQFDTPGLFSNPKYVHSVVTAAIDWRTSPGYTRKGGYYGVTFVDYTDVDDTFSFQRLDGELVQHLPILRETWVISLRARVQSTLDDNDVVPYFLLPQLGSGRTLRAYPTGRFRDRHALLTNAELRWIPSRVGLDMAIFYDAGKVAPRLEDLDFDGMNHNWGIGARFHGPTATVLRLEAAYGTDGWHLVFATSAAF